MDGGDSGTDVQRGGLEAGGGGRRGSVTPAVCRCGGPPPCLTPVRPPRHGQGGRFLRSPSQLPPPRRRPAESPGAVGSRSPPEAGRGRAGERTAPAYRAPGRAAGSCRRRRDGHGAAGSAGPPRAAPPAPGGWAAGSPSGQVGTGCGDRGCGDRGWGCWGGRVWGQGVWAIGDGGLWGLGIGSYRGRGLWVRGDGRL